MADRASITKISRRTVLASTAAVPVMALPGVPAFAALPGFAAPDLRLLRRVVVAKRLRKQHARACRLLDRLRQIPHDDPELPGVCLDSLRWEAAWRTGRRDLMLRRSDLFRRYTAAVRGAVATPAHTLCGVHAKLDLAVIASRRGDARVYLYEDQEWLRLALGDLERLAEP